MPRKVDTFTVSKENRDKGKSFTLTEMSAYDGERWALRAILAITNTGAAVPAEALEAGMAGLAVVGIQAMGLLKADTVQPLLDELWACVKYQPNPKTLARQPMENDIEEVSTRVDIYQALLKLHTGFSMPVASPTSESEAAGAEKAVKSGWITSMSRALLGLLSRLG